MYEKGKHGNKTKKIDANREAQYEEIKDFINGKKTAQAMADISMRRLEEFVKVRKGDLERWKQRLREKGNQKENYSEWIERIRKWPCRTEIISGVLRLTRYMTR